MVAPIPSPSGTPVLALHGVSRVYHQGPTTLRALGPLSLVIEPGHFITIVGTSGSGKSTLLHLLGLLDLPSEGSLHLMGIDVQSLHDNARTRLRRDQIGFVFQFFNLLPTMSALENVALPARLAGKPLRSSRARALYLLERVGLAQRANHHPDQMSGGEMQRVAIARALMLDPPLLLADEPTGNLDSASGQAVLNLLQEERGNRTLVLVTHDNQLAKLGDRILRMGDGRILEEL